jgi:hypothetical protein
VAHPHRHDARRRPAAAPETERREAREDRKQATSRPLSASTSVGDGALGTLYGRTFPPSRRARTPLEPALLYRADCSGGKVFESRRSTCGTLSASPNRAHPLVAKVTVQVGHRLHRAAAFGRTSARSADGGTATILFEGEGEPKNSHAPLTLADKKVMCAEFGRGTVADSGRGWTPLRARRRGRRCARYLSANESEFV